MHTIESGIPIPTSRGTIVSALRAMKVGDSTVIPAGKEGSWRTVASRVGVSVSIRSISKKQSRVWRIG